MKGMVPVISLFIFYHLGKEDTIIDELQKTSSSSFIPVHALCHLIFQLLRSFDGAIL